MSESFILVILELIQVVCDRIAQENGWWNKKCTKLLLCVFEIITNSKVSIVVEAIRNLVYLTAKHEKVLMLMTAHKVCFFV